MCVLSGSSALDEKSVGYATEVERSIGVREYIRFLKSRVGLAADGDRPRSEFSYKGREEVVNVGKRNSRWPKFTLACTVVNRPWSGSEGRVLANGVSGVGRKQDYVGAWL